MALKKEKSVVSDWGRPTSRITRARAAALRASGTVLPLESPLIEPDKKQTRGNSKRAASDENNLNSTLGVTFQQKKRDVLRDVSNICSKSSYKNCIKAVRQQSKVSQCVKLGLPKGELQSDLKDSELMLNASDGSQLVQDEEQNEMVDFIQEVPIVLDSQKSTVSINPENIWFAPQHLESVRYGENLCATALLKKHGFRQELKDHSGNVKNNLYEDIGGLSSLDYIDIDSDHADPQLCSLYAPEAYSNLRAAELIRRPHSDFMENLQRDITQSMRGILIDWLVEVSEEYRLVPDTLYLTVYVIDRFLSQNFMERQRLQLLGITCMLIASKYEEICAPRVDELCFITDNTYSKNEVLKMESQVLNYLGFQLSVPTVKTFLRRFLRAAQASFKVTTLSLGYLANYLAELTLLEYSFLKYLPSIIAASAIFLARWTLDQSCHPWDSTLQHYSSYEASDLRVTVAALQTLQMNSKNCRLNAIHEKYTQEKFKCVAGLTSPELIPSLFR